MEFGINKRCIIIEQISHIQVLIYNKNCTKMKTNYLKEKYNRRKHTHTKIIILQFIQETKKQHPSFAILEVEGYFACV